MTEDQSQIFNDQRATPLELRDVITEQVTEVDRLRDVLKLFIIYDDMSTITAERGSGIILMAKYDEAITAAREAMKGVKP